MKLEPQQTISLGVLGHVIKLFFKFFQQPMDNLLLVSSFQPRIRQLCLYVGFSPLALLSFPKRSVLNVAGNNGQFSDWDMSDSKVSDEQSASVAVAAKLKAAMAYRNARRYESALRSIDEALSIQPNSELAWLTKGVVLAELGQCNESLSCYDKLIALDAGSAVAYRLKGATFEMQGSFGKAADCFLKAIELEPSNMGLRLNLANSYKKQKKYDDALKCYQQMLEREPKNPTINLPDRNRLGRHREI